MLLQHVCLSVTIRCYVKTAKHIVETGQFIILWIAQN